MYQPKNKTKISMPRSPFVEQTISNNSNNSSTKTNMKMLRWTKNSKTMKMIKMNRITRKINTKRGITSKTKLKGEKKWTKNNPKIIKIRW